MYKKIPFWGLGVCSASILLLSSPLVHASGTQTFSKELLSATTAKTGEVISYRFKLACSSLTSDCGNLTISDTLPDGLEAVSCEVPTGFTVVSCTSANSDISITKNDTFNGGDSFIIDVTTRVKLGTAQGTALANTATAVITAPDVPENASVLSTANTVTVGGTAPNWTLKKARVSPATNLKPAPNTDVGYQVDFCSNSAVGNVNLTGVSLKDAFPAGATVVNNGGATESGSELIWTLGDQDLATLYTGKDYNSPVCITKTYTLRYPEATFPIGTSITNTLSATSNEGTVGTNVVITEDIGKPTPGVTMNKWSQDVLAGSMPPSTGFNWGIRADTFASNAPVPDLTLYDTLPATPAGLVPTEVFVGTWTSPPTTNAPTGSDVRLTLSHSADAGDCKAATYTDLVVDVASDSSPASHALPANTTCLRWKFKDLGADGPAVPRGWQFNPWWATTIKADTSAIAGPYPVEVKNCVVGTFTNFDGSTGASDASCPQAFVEEATPAIWLDKSVTNGSAFAPDSEVKFKLYAGHAWNSSTAAAVNPIVSDLLPPELDFVSWDTFAGEGPATGMVEPNLEVIKDYNGTGRTLVRFSWSDTPPADSVKRDGSAGVANPVNFGVDSGMTLELTAKVKPGTLVGTYTNEMAFFDHSPRFSCMWSTEVVDSNDMDGDANTTENACTKPIGFNVVSAAVIAAEKWVKGEFPTYPNVDDPLTLPAVTNEQCPNDGSGYTRFPCVAQVQHAGAFDYKLIVSNKGNEPLTNYILYDVLPMKGDTGVGQPVSTLQRGSQWQPVLAGAITAADAYTTSANAVFEYSIAANPCRPEVSSSATESPANHWQADCTDDWTAAPADFSKVTAFRIKAAFATAPYWEPLKALTFNVPMLAPENAPPSIVGNSKYFSPAWNSLAHRVTQQSNSQRLDTAEPRQVGIIVPTIKYRIGNLVWKDANNNGIADASEAGIAEVDVNLLDSSNAVIATTKTDANGYYVFEGLAAGTYRVAIPTPTTQAALNGLKSSENGEEASPDADLDNNDNGVTLDPLLGLISGNITLEESPGEPENEQQRTDNTDDDNDAWPDIASNVTVDFGFFTVPEVDIKLVKIADKTAVKRGETVIYTLTATNEGRDNATAIKVTDQLPAGVTYVSDNSDPSAYDHNTGVWNVGDLAKNESKTLIITVTVK
ncbi:MAG: carboxypeptidase regulatory-like domain-containing protein [Candidatus Thiothrix sulfatifontis]|nr:MAG: carboxypeptidase regulatory-like domain-containing protein [Candidatus Thiothrix sulfatifontis]